MTALDHKQCYDAISRRDARFDGRFYTGVTSTGIFCRPSCPARTPKQANVRFFAHAASASEAGFRPCRRCRPELAPGDPEWNRRADLVGRAIRAIDAGEVDRHGVAGLARQLGVSERHLRRELQREVGTGPLQLARSRRLWLARLLLDQTSLSVTDVAFAAGFGSLRQFNDSMRQAFDAAPSELRRRRGGPGSNSGQVTVNLSTRGRLGWPALHRFLVSRAVPGLEEYGEQTFRRRLAQGWFELAPGPDGTLAVTCASTELSALADVVPIVRRVADLDTDLEPIEEHLRRDPELARRLDQVPLPRLPGPFDPFEVAVRAVVGQQISVAGARTLLGRLVALVDEHGGTRGPLGFPTARSVAETPLDDLGMPAGRRRTITTLARAVADDDLTLGPHADVEATTEALLALPGIGPWTAGYIAMRALSHPDGWPDGDLVLARTLDLDKRALAERAESWRPWRAYAALLLWATA